MIAAVVPVKSLASSKSRLQSDFDRESVERLCIAMLEDVLEALLRVEKLPRVAVITPDPDVAVAARRAGAAVLLRDDPGLNPAVESAAAELVGAPGDGALVVLGDVAGVRSEEVEQLIDVLDAPGVALAPSSDGGTSALLRIPHDVIRAGFGPESARVHRERAERAGVRFRELSLPSLAVDVDGREDLVALSASSSAAPRTRALWRELERRTTG